MVLTLGCVCRLSQFGYHAVFSLAIGLVVLDILLRLGMIEQKTAAKWMKPDVTVDGETDDLLNNGSAAADNCLDYGSTVQGQSEQTPEHCQAQSAVPTSDPDGHDKGESMSSGKSSTVPGFIRMMLSVDLMVVFGATVTDGILYSSFDTVSNHAIDSYVEGLDRMLTITATGTSSIRHEDISLGTSNDRTMFPSVIHPVFLLPVVRYAHDTKRTKPKKSTY